MNWQSMPQQLKLEPYVVHATFQFVDANAKRHRLREALLFYDQPAYYDTPGPLEVSYHSNLVMPRLWCRFERMWFAHPGILEGTLTRQPFVCPMDHLFEV
uniref:Uncharacterized protein n=1 Tax=Ensete ventricosum TaxID=4639 RepID=A0A426YJJ2_ENSVE|nr:hypothetical protein B296_00021835 [Ensete ventricosum]RWW66404.1 hypothetical protein BHE74_00026227 [Ensete ventricosum]RZS04598.1 hypothetical protein BHM03_00034955 [Ensete ventricosum]